MAGITDMSWKWLGQFFERFEKLVDQVFSRRRMVAHGEVSTHQTWLLGKVKSLPLLHVGKSPTQYVALRIDCKHQCPRDYSHIT